MSFTVIARAVDVLLRRMQSLGQGNDSCVKCGVKGTDESGCFEYIENCGMEQ